MYWFIPKFGYIFCTDHGHWTTVWNLPLAEWSKYEDASAPTG